MTEEDIQRQAERMRDAARQVLPERWQQQLARPLDDDSLYPWARLVRAGWPPNAYARLISLGVHAARVAHDGEPLASPFFFEALYEAGTVDDFPPELLGYEMLSQVALLATARGATWPALEPWLVVLAGEPTVERRIGTWRLLCDWPAGAGAWPALLGPLAALAYAAGHTGDTAAAAGGTGGLVEAELRERAAARGYRLPAS